jgi:hypothetical protein
MCRVKNVAHVGCLGVCGSRADATWVSATPAQGQMLCGAQNSRVAVNAVVRGSRVGGWLLCLMAPVLADVRSSQSPQLQVIGHICCISAIAAVAAAATTATICRRGACRRCCCGSCHSQLVVYGAVQAVTVRLPEEVSDRARAVQEREREREARNEAAGGNDNTKESTFMHFYAFSCI